MIKIEEGSGNVYADLGMADADEMMVKAQLATKIGEIIKGHKWSQQQAADGENIVLDERHVVAGDHHGQLGDQSESHGASDGSGVHGFFRVFSPGQDCQVRQLALSSTAPARTLRSIWCRSPGRATPPSGRGSRSC